MIRKKVGKSNYKFIILSITTITLVLIILYGVAVLQSKKSALEKPFGKFKTLSVKEVFENNFSNVASQISIFSNPKIIGFDEMKNIFLLELRNTGSIKLSINGMNVDNTEERYQELYKKALFNIMKNNPPEDYNTTKPSLIFERITDYSYDYLLQNDKDYIVLKGKSGIDNVEMWVLFRKINNRVKIFIEKVFINGNQLSDVRKAAFLSNIYQVEKQIVKMNLIEIVKSSKLLEFPDVELNLVFDNLQNGRWMIENEDQNLVEFRGVNKIQDTEESIVVGFKLRGDGFVDLEYLYLNEVELPKDQALNKIREIYKQFGKFDEDQYVGQLIEKIKSSRLREMDKTIGKFFDETKTFYTINWNHSFKGLDTELIMKGKQKTGNMTFEVHFLASSGKLYLTKSYLNNKEIEPIKLFRTLEEAIAYENLALNSISLVKNSCIVDNSPFKNNASAFEKFLKNPTWSYNQQKNRVILNGIGRYAGKNWNFKFVFELPLTNRVLLEYVYANDIELIDEVRDYLISKIFNVNQLSDNLAILVRNTVFKMKTYGELLGKKNWNIDRVNDLIIYNDSKLKVNFLVEPDGTVNITGFYYKGKEYNKNDVYKILSTAEENYGLLSMENILNNFEKATKTSFSDEEIAKPSTQSTDNSFIEKPLTSPVEKLKQPDDEIIKNHSKEDKNSNTEEEKNVTPYHF
ncbi:MAG: hypothetical protein N2Z58_04710 [Fervidobacterium sp.]|nr:hypothetical protein [Fervidobacterium sp.]